ncbi:hypothetical protein [Pseudoalteromonas sp.]|uniref:hypothetical protein n=1 Tax=Pseudoalteromonas sp. TaxID=53249 RepID=UPI0035C6AF12
MRTLKISLFILIGLSLWWSRVEGPLRDPEEALKDFYETQYRAESQLQDPLILNGSNVLPLVLRDLPDKNMPRRRYAIGYIGNGRYEEAIPALKKILHDNSELNYFRADALEAIYQIDMSLSRNLAANFTNEPELLGRVAKKIVSGESPIYSERTFWDAFMGIHH